MTDAARVPMRFPTKERAMLDAEPPTCAKCSKATRFRGVVDSPEEGEFWVFQCTNCTRLDLWHRQESAWIVHRPTAKALRNMKARPTE
jgi:hypothetical protein